MSTHCDNVAKHLALKQEAQVQRKHTVHPNDDISKGNQNLTNNAPVAN